MPICLDFHHDLSQSIIPQHYWQPTTDTNFGRYVTGAKLEKPIFLDHLNGGGFGLTVAEACKGNSTHIRRWNEVAELGGKATVQVRVWVFHTSVWKRQISTRDQTIHRKAITLRQFVRHLGTTMRDYLKVQTGQLITNDDLVILAAVHVSAGSW
ncbi:uncharacterized protein STEHIDRAFT_133709 [Stereum hirsutum FP-91666 SS1]|uniref:uncharacterized protein n=1 Tax=Stereum hirsutum (strain FP-91666) TaxID=721885 RepID=UPI000444A142|nr:uncharacterized protein STEHIDRAFT_133709 [Stereum hirsutum FP-91666 SS1]EIM82911.1 hypothetical protein STEHIDRAFT_133709 [Stereum hirsutum FP-91666 SS1]